MTPGSPAPPRRVLHVDMDAFYASVEQRERPELRGKPVLVGSDRPRGVVCAASYEARTFGCRSAQPMVTAKRLCPSAAIVAPRMDLYTSVSEQVFAILEGVSPLVEPLSVDEAFVEATGTELLFGPAEELAAEVKLRIREETGLTASVGVAPNKFLAKIASDLRKPDGLVSVPSDGVEAFLAPLPVERLWGVGPATAAQLHALGVRTIADLRAWPEARLIERFGAGGPRFFRLCRGLDDRPVVPETQAKSLGREHTFETDVEDADEVRGFLMAQAEAVGRRLRRHGLRAGGVGLKLRYGDFVTISRGATLPQPTDATLPLRDAAVALFDAWAASTFRPVRLVGVVAIKLEGGPVQGDLFPDTEQVRLRRLDAALDEIAGRFGASALRRGRLATPKRGADGFGDPADA